MSWGITMPNDDQGNSDVVRSGLMFENWLYNVDKKVSRRVGCTCIDIVQIAKSERKMAQRLRYFLT